VKYFTLGIPLILGVSLVADPQELSPAEALSQALAQVKPCPTQSEAHRLDEGHQPIVKIEENNEGKKGKPKITLPMLFRSGRFELIDVGAWVVLGREVRVLSFYPAKHNQPKAWPGEDKDYDKAMNHLVGWIYLDKETGDLARVDARLSKELNYRFGLVSITEAMLTFEQAFVQGEWQPEVFKLDFDGHGPGGIRRRHELRTYRFLCTE
jgi:hypothetical protein